MTPRFHLPVRRRKKDTDKNNSSTHGVDLQRAGLAIATIVALSVLLSMHLFPSKVSLAVGDAAPKEIRAHRTVRYRDRVETERKKAEAVASVGKFYDADQNALKQARSELENILSVIDKDRDNSTLQLNDSVNETSITLEKDIGIDLSFATLKTLISVHTREFEQIVELAYRLVQESMAGEIHDDQPRDILQAKREINQQADRYFGSSESSSAAAELAGAVIRPNRLLNMNRTASAQEKARDSVESVWRQIVSGELIISPGERVTQEHIGKFEALGLQNPQPDYRSIISLCVFVSFLVALVLIYLARYQSDIYKSTKLLALFSLIVTLSTLGLRLGGNLLGINLSGLQLAYLGTACVVWAGMILALLLNPQVAVLTVALLAITSGIIMNSELRFAAVTLVTGLVAIFSVANIRDRRDLGRAMTAIAITYVAMVWIIGGISGDVVADMLKGSLWGIVIAMAATAVFWFGTAPLERLFGLMTHIALLELADANSPLMRRLAMEAPGTYAHSVAVGQLAASGAEAVGADALFARIAAYYHDIGKIKRPHFFIENQRVENAHDRLNPTISALVVTSHIKDGIDLAKEYGLPEPMKQVIMQHHGTSLAQYFYSQICGETEPTTVLEQQFRYDGPKPSTREAGIVMLADIVEAASRSLTKPTQPRLEALVDKVIKDRLIDGQLDESNLTFADINKIKQAFAHTLVGRLHARIEYPDGTPDEVKQTSDNGDSDTETTEVAGQNGTSESDREEAPAS